MAITSAPFALKNLGLDAEPLRQAVASLLPNHGGIVQAGDLAVTQTGTPSLGVSISTGRAWMPGTNTANLAGKTYSTQGQYFALNDAPATVNLSTANATNPRIDLIYIGAVDTQYGGASNIIKFDKITGTPAASPVAPSLPAGSNAIALATVTVAANATSVTNANIVNLAVPAGRKYAELVTNTSNWTIAGGSQSWDAGPFGIDSSRTFNNTFVGVGALSGSFDILETGTYSIVTNTLGSGSPGNGWVSCRLNGNEIIATGSTAGYAWEISTAGTFYATAGSYIRLSCMYTNAVNNSVTRARIFKLSN